MKKYFLYIISILFLIIFSFCNKQKKDAENALLEEYFANNEFNIIDTIEDGLYLIKSGFSTPETLSSDLPKQGDTVISIFRGYLLSDPDVIFDEASFENPQYYAFKEDPVIPGWELSIGHMKKDASTLLIIQQG